MIDLGLIAQAKKAVAAKPRRFVTPAFLLAVVQQESHGVPYFTDTKPGSQYSLNVQGAQRYTKSIPDKAHPGEWVHIRCSTQLKEGQIRAFATIAQKIAGWTPPKEMRGQIAKFRFEWGYWEHYHALAVEDRFLMSCSWGLVQFMGPNITKNQTDAAAIDTIRRFAADVPMQLLYGAGMLDDLLVKAEGDIHHAYRGYNSGKVDNQNRDVIARADNVVRMTHEIDVQLKATRS